MQAKHEGNAIDTKKMTNNILIYDLILIGFDTNLEKENKKPKIIKNNYFQFC